MFTLLGTGLLAGAVHVWSGPDHLAAVAPLAARRPARSWLAGLRWGVGHSTGVAVVGLLALWLRDALPMELLSHWSERLVGVLLIGIGLWAIRKATRTTIHAHEHEHDGERHVHIHAHGSGARDHEARGAHQHSHAAVGIGLLHGLAGSSHFFGVLPVLALPTRMDAAVYLGSFGVGTILSMVMFSWLIGLTAGRSARRSGNFYRGFVGACGVCALLVGCGWLFLGGH